MKAGFQGSWLQSYAGIRQASILIDNVDINEDYTPEEIKDVKSASPFFRHTCWLLLRKYGPCSRFTGKPSTITPHTMIFHYRKKFTNATLSKEMLLAQRRTSLTNVISSTSDVLPRAALAVRAKSYYLYAASPLDERHRKMADFVDDKGRI